MDFDIGCAGGGNVMILVNESWVWRRVWRLLMRYVMCGGVIVMWVGVGVVMSWCVVRKNEERWVGGG